MSGFGSVTVKVDRSKVNLNMLYRTFCGWHKFSHVCLTYAATRICHLQALENPLPIWQVQLFGTAQGLRGVS